MTQAGRTFQLLCGYVSSMASNNNRQFRLFQHFGLIDFLLTQRFFITYVCHGVWHDSCLQRGAMLRTNCEAIMWKITTRGFTLEEVLIMAAMNLLTSADTAAKREELRI